MTRPAKLTGALRHSETHRQAVRRAIWRLQCGPIYIADLIPAELLDMEPGNIIVVREMFDEFNRTSFHPENPLRTAA